MPNIISYMLCPPTEALISHKEGPGYEFVLKKKFRWLKLFKISKLLSSCWMGYNDRLYKSINRLYKAINRLYKSINRLYKAINRLYKSINRLCKSINRLYKSINRLYKSINHLYKAINRLYKAINCLYKANQHQQKLWSHTEGPRYEFVLKRGMRWPEMFKISTLFLLHDSQYQSGVKQKYCKPPNITRLFESDIKVRVT